MPGGGTLTGRVDLTMGCHGIGRRARAKMNCTYVCELDQITDGWSRS